MSKNKPQPYPAEQLPRAAADGDPGLVKALLSEGAYIDGTNHNGHTALICAAFFGHLDVVRILLAAGADTQTKDGHGLTALDWSIARGFPEVAQLLRATVPAEDTKKERLQSTEPPAVITEFPLDQQSERVSEAKPNEVFTQEKRRETASEPLYYRAFTRERQLRQGLGESAAQPLSEPSSTVRPTEPSIELLNDLSHAKRDELSTKPPKNPAAQAKPGEPFTQPVRDPSTQPLRFTAAFKREMQHRQAKLAELTQPITESAAQPERDKLAQPITKSAAQPEPDQLTQPITTSAAQPEPDQLAQPTGNAAAQSELGELAQQISNEASRPELGELTRPISSDVVQAEFGELTQPISKSAFQPIPGEFIQPLAKAGVPQPGDRAQTIKIAASEPTARPTLPKPRALFWVTIAIGVLAGGSAGYFFMNHRQAEPPAQTAIANPANSSDVKDIKTSPRVEGEIKGSEISLPEPEYPEAAKRRGMSGSITVAITVNSKGKVITARSSAGQQPLRKAATAAARKAVFAAQSGRRRSGRITYDFHGTRAEQTPATTISASEKNVAELETENYPIVEGAIKGSAISLPEPEYPEAAKRRRLSELITVAVTVNSKGKVITARPSKGSQILRKAAESAARKAVFKSPQEAQRSGTITYRFRP